MNATRKQATMDAKRRTCVSKFLSLVLRHEPQKIGISLDPAGWVGAGELLEALARNEFPVSPQELREVVARSDKKRFAFSEDGLRIRASQGHSVEVELGYHPTQPPELLFHGTVDRFIDSIRAEGLRKGERHHVHLSPDESTANIVGERRGKPVLLRIQSGRMHRDGIEFFVSANGVWLTDHVAAKYIEFPEGTS
jgi:putative RNA 2'-phosphotransferase